VTSLPEIGLLSKVAFRVCFFPNPSHTHSFVHGFFFCIFILLLTSLLRDFPQTPPLIASYANNPTRCIVNTHSVPCFPSFPSCHVSWTPFYLTFRFRILSRFFLIALWDSFFEHRFSGLLAKEELRFLVFLSGGVQGPYPIPPNPHPFVDDVTESLSFFLPPTPWPVPKSPTDMAVPLCSFSTQVDPFFFRIVARHPLRSLQILRIVSERCWRFFSLPSVGFGLFFFSWLLAFFLRAPPQPLYRNRAPFVAPRPPPRLGFFSRHGIIFLLASPPFSHFAVVKGTCPHDLFLYAVAS